MKLPKITNIKRDGRKDFVAETDEGFIIYYSRTAKPGIQKLEVAPDFESSRDYNELIDYLNKCTDYACYQDIEHLIKTLLEQFRNDRQVQV